MGNLKKASIKPMVAVKERQTCCVLIFTDISVQLKFCHGRFLGDTNDCEMSQKLRFISKGRLPRAKAQHC
jgi:hypothetical protein